MDIIPRLDAGKDIKVEGTVKNVGTEKAPEYLVRMNIVNNGTGNFECPMAFGCFLSMGEEAAAAAQRQGIDTTIIVMDPRGMTGRTIEPGYGSGYTFESGSNITELARINGGYLRFNLMVLKPTKNLKTAELLVFTINDLPTVLSIDGREEELKPGETKKLDVYQAS